MRPQKYIKFLLEINYEWLQFPLSINKVSKLEKLIPINVLFYENHNPLYNSSHGNRKHHVNLLLIMDESNVNSHYLLIRSLSLFVDDRTKHNGAKHVSPYFIYCFTEEHYLTSHILDYSIHPAQRLKYPSPRDNNDVDYNILKFKNFAETLPVPVGLYCDFETFLVPVEHNAKLQPKQSYLVEFIRWCQ